MERDIIAELLAWKESPFRKPLVLRGARQVGKTWALKEFGRRAYKNCAYVTLEEIAPGVPSEYAQLFETTKDPRRIVSNLSLALGEPIVPGETLIIFDEIQDCPAAIGSLKYFCDDAPEYHVACAGSLLGVKLTRGYSVFPVGKVEFADMGPMTFSEFLRAVDLANLDEYLSSVDSFDPVPNVFHERLSEQLQRYFVTGGHAGICQQMGFDARCIAGRSGAGRSAHLVYERLCQTWWRRAVRKALFGVALAARPARA